MNNHPITNVRTSSISSHRQKGARLAAGVCFAAAIIASHSSLAQVPDDFAAAARTEALLAKLTQAEKVQLLHGEGWSSMATGAAGRIKGIPRLGIPDISYVDSAAGPHVKDKNATPLPSPIAVAASWDMALAYDVGQHIATEVRTLGFNAGLGGGINLTREPRGGRTFEYLGEDPLLAGKMLSARLKGTAAGGILSVAKHYALNDQETNRFNADAIVDERTLRQYYLLPFEIAVKEGRPSSIMCSYNLVNGQKSCENRKLLTDILKGDWGFPGYVQSDWALAITDTERAANAGTDEEMPGSDNNDKPDAFGLPTFFNQKLTRAVSAGRVTQARLDDMVRRKLLMLDRAGMIGKPALVPGVIDTAAGDRMALRAAQNVMVLLKNDNRAGAPVLPLDKGRLKSVAVIGGHADVAIISGGGSGQVPPRGGDPVKCLKPGANVLNVPLCANWYASPPLAAIRAKMPGGKVSWASGDDREAAIRNAADADVTVLFVTQFVSEQMDLKSLALPGAEADPVNQAYDQVALIEAVAARAKRLVVVLENGTAVTMPWAGKANAILAAWYPGIKGGEAIADVLFGDVNPSGKLPLSFPNDESELPQPVATAAGELPKPGSGAAIGSISYPHDEGMLVGYRRYDALKGKPLFAFGHGLSYTRFRYSTLKLATQPSGDVTVSFTLTNVGRRAGAEVAQVYASLPAAAGEPKRLVAWEKVLLAPGEQRQVSVVVPAVRFGVWQKKWLVPAGQARLIVGSSSEAPEDIGGLSGQVSLDARDLPGGA
ncbi:MAG TPA: glycoside hydrolase family 3 C-terminal domain-containing protein [Sphingobium sp.]|uniref:beta-glucosidase n=1 Tax=Sphingobium sp. TaxID=1912891 RepID=UPI002ED1D8CF